MAEHGMCILVQDCSQVHLRSTGMQCKQASGQRHGTAPPVQPHLECQPALGVSSLLGLQQRRHQLHMAGTGGSGQEATASCMPTKRHRNSGSRSKCTVVASCAKTMYV